MPIPFWRYVDHKDDGISEFECLSCYEKIYTGSLHGWKFCPYCGLEWKGEHKWDQEAKSVRKGWTESHNRAMDGLDPYPGKQTHGAYWIESQTSWPNSLGIKSDGWREEYTIQYGDRRDHGQYTGTNISVLILDTWKRNLERDRFHTTYYRLMYRSPSNRVRVLLAKIVPPSKDED